MVDTKGSLMGRMVFAAAVLMLIAGYDVWAVNDRLEERFAWKQVDFAFPNENSRRVAKETGAFIQENNLPLGLEVWRDKLFVTLPRWKPGIPATLTYIYLNSTEKSPKLIPYPGWEAHVAASSAGRGSGSGSSAAVRGKITSVFRLNVDVCDRLWLVDHGVYDIFGEGRRLHPPRIQIYDLAHGDKLIKEYTFPKEVLREASFLANIVVDVTANNCNAAFAYVPDLSTYGLIVYDLTLDDSWRVSHHYFHFDPLAGDFTIDGINFQWTDGIFGVALSPINSDSSSSDDDGYRTLYFHPMASTREFAVSTKVIRNKTIALSESSFHEYKVLGSRGPNSQSSASSVDDRTGVLFYTLLNKNAVGCWSTRSDEYSADTNAVIASDSETMIFPNDLKVDKNGTLWVLTDRLPTLLYSTLNLTDVNYRIFSAPVERAIRGTACDLNRIKQ